MTIKIHKVAEGPITSRDFPDHYLDIGADNHADAMVEILVEQDGEYPIASTMFFYTMDGAYQFCNWMNTHIGPITIITDNEGNQILTDPEGNELLFGDQNA